MTRTDCFAPVRHSMVIHLLKVNSLNPSSLHEFCDIVNAVQLVYDSDPLKKVDAKINRTISNFLNTNMQSSLVVIIGVFFTRVYGLGTFDEEFTRNVFQDDEEYSMVDPNYSLETEPENQYFREIRAFQEDYKMVDKTEGFYSNFLNRRGNTLLGSERIKRNAAAVATDDDDKNLQVAIEIERDIEKHLGKPLEIAVLELENATETINQTKEEPENNNLIINDFIRFKRDLNSTRLKREKDRRGKTLLTTSSEFDTSREPRGATKEQWVKQPYPVLNSKGESYEDSVNSDSIRAPRVHFVTQRRSESSPTPAYKTFERDSRSRELNNYPDGNYYQRPPRHYESYPPPSPPPQYRPNYYYPRDRPRYENTYYENNSKFQGTERPVYNKQRRIIYYATLPEVVRTPPNVDLNDQYNYRDRYDSRFLSSTPLAVSGADPYRYRKPYSPSKSRYDEIERSKSPYSLKVSTDINVREIKKNPERRIYSEGDRRYAYGIPPYHHRPDEISYSERRP